MDNSLKHYFHELLILSFPLLIGNIGHTLIGMTDILVTARYGIDALAAISIANSILFTIFMFGIGIMNAVSIILSNKRGQRERIKGYLLPSLIFSFFSASIFSIICYLTSFFIDKAGFDPKLVPLIEDYIKIVSFSLFGVFIYQGVKEFLQSYEIVKFPNMVLLYSVVVNLILDITLVFGTPYTPSLGVKGAAIATFIVRTLMGLTLFLYVFRSIKFKFKFEKSYYYNMIKIGTPIGLALTFEILAFNIITILAGREAAVLAAVHSILTTISSATFMIPLSVSTALSVKIAYFYGAKKYLELKSFSIAGLILGVGFMTAAAIVLAVFPNFLINLFTNDKDVVRIALPLITIAAMYQVFDGLQVVMGGILRGFKLTKIVSASVFFGYWFVGAPVAYIFVYKYNMSLRGYWLALALSLFTMGIIQTYFVKNKFRHIKRIEFNDGLMRV